MPHIINLKNLKQTNNSQSPPLIEWTALEFEAYEKNISWFIIFGTIVSLSLLATVIFKNYTLTIVVLLAALCIYLYSKKEPRKINFSISHRGISVGNKLYPYGELKSFWIFYNPPELKQLSVKSKKTFSQYIGIPLNEQNPNQVRSFLLKYIPEIEQEESLTDALSEKIKF